MSEIDFAMTYPCYFLEGSSDSMVKTCRSDVGEGILLFTDADLAETYHEQIVHPVTGATEAVVRYITSREKLLEFLADYKDGWAEEGVTDLAIDVTKGKRPMLVEVEEFVRELEKH